MSPDDIKHFLVIYNAATGEVKVKSLGTDYEAAQDKYAEAEQANAESGAALDVVLLSADSLETIKTTHSSYFRDRDRTLEELLPS